MCNYSVLFCSFSVSQLCVISVCTVIDHGFTLDKMFIGHMYIVQIIIGASATIG